MNVYILLSISTESTEIEGVMSSRCKAQFLEDELSSLPAYEGATFFIQEETIDEFIN